MNYRGSYRHLRKNAVAAMMGAIEIYNKPRFQYREECFIILLLNAWELILKAIISKQKKSIHYPKRRREPYRTLSLKHSLNKAEQFFPEGFQSLPVRKNLELLITYRDNAVHFYNEKGFGLLIYALAQTSIINFKDLLDGFFGIDMREEISWHLMPLGVQPPIDPIQYFSRDAGNRRLSTAVRQFIAELSNATKEVEDASKDTGRLLTIFSVNLQSTKKIQKADVIVGVDTTTEFEGPLVISRMVDPNVSHPLRQKDVKDKVGKLLHGREFNNHVLQAIVWKYELREKSNFCWRDSKGALVKYSNEMPAWIRRLSEDELSNAILEYRKYLSLRRRKSSVTR